MIKKIEDKINRWCHRWMSRGGRMVLVKSVLESIHVYWLSIAHIPKTIIERIHRKCSNFLWTCSKEKEGIPIFKWSRISTLKEFGGWGLKKLHIFGQALAAKSLWRLLFNKGLWGKVMREKYLEDRDLEEYIRHEPKSFKGSSNVWKGLVKAYAILG
jgi:hypothetical protein